MGAGCVIVNRQGSILALKTFKGKWDFPKGSANSSDDGDFSTATRETYEECGLKITEEDLVLPNPLTLPYLTMYLVRYPTNQTPRIQINPKTDKSEHQSWAWITLDEFRGNSRKHLHPVATWAMAHILILRGRGVL